MWAGKSVAAASSGAGRVVRSRAADHRNRLGSVTREKSQAFRARRFDHHVQRPSARHSPFDTLPPPVPESRRAPESSRSKKPGHSKKPVTVAAIHVKVSYFNEPLVRMIALM